MEATEKSESCAEERFNPHINIYQSHTLDRVLKEVSKAEEEYKVEGSKGSWSSLLNGSKRLGENHTAFNAWIGLFPKSVLCEPLNLFPEPQLAGANEGMNIHNNRQNSDSTSEMTILLERVSDV